MKGATDFDRRGYNAPPVEQVEKPKAPLPSCAIKSDHALAVRQKALQKEIERLSVEAKVTMDALREVAGQPEWQANIGAVWLVKRYSFVSRQTTFGVFTTWQAALAHCEGDSDSMTLLSFNTVSTDDATATFYPYDTGEDGVSGLRKLYRFLGLPEEVLE